MTHARAMTIAVTLAALFAAGQASAQQRPLITEDPETIGGGRLQVFKALAVERLTAPNPAPSL